MSEKNTFKTITITDLNTDGNGIGRTDEGKVVFVPLTAPGDICEVKIIKDCGGYLIGRTERILQPADCRIEPECAVYNRCGGCSYLHVTYEKEKILKEETVRNAFLRIGGLDVKINPLISVNSSGYRNKVQYPISKGELLGSLLFGYYARHSHKVTEHDRCILQDDVFYNISKRLIGIFEQKGFSAYDEVTGKGLLRHIYMRKTVKGDICVCIVVNSKILPEADKIAQEISEYFPQVRSFYYNINKEKTNVILGEKYVLVTGSRYLIETLAGKNFALSPASFFQVNNAATEKLYEKAAEYAALQKNDILLDLYCGTGTVGLCIAGESNPLCGVEIVEDAIKDAKENAARNGRSKENTVFVCGDAAVGISECKKTLGNPSVIVVDPPRKGLTEGLIKDIIKAEPKRVVYISCNPATLARDCAVFASGGYSVKEATPFDLFPRTGHVETVILLSQQRPKDRIPVELNLTEMDITATETEATYQEIKDYINEKHGVKVSSLYISQVKRKYGLEVGESYNKPKSDDSKQPQCPEAKEKVIRDALTHFHMI